MQITMKCHFEEKLKPNHKIFNFFFFNLSVFKLTFLNLSAILESFKVTNTVQECQITLPYSTSPKIATFASHEEKKQCTVLTSTAKYSPKETPQL